MNSKPSNPKDAIGIRKAPMSTVSAAVLAEVGVAMLEGAAKYGRHNYRAVGVQSSVYYDATMRHLMAWWEGEDTDPDSGMSHITKAITSLVVLRDAMIQGMLTDDRAPRSAEFYGRLNELSGQILDRHADKTPKHYTIADELQPGAAPVPSAVPARRWIDWLGGEMPVPPGTTVEVKYRDGGSGFDKAGRDGGLAESWSHDGNGADIVAYRVVALNGL